MNPAITLHKYKKFSIKFYLPLNLESYEPYYFMNYEIKMYLITKILLLFNYYVEILATVVIAIGNLQLTI